MTIGGYVLCNLKGLDLDSSSEQTIEGAYADTLNAITTGKVIYVTGCENTGTLAPAFPVRAIVNETDEEILLKADMIQILIASDDGITVTDLSV